jgi:hypothetical protein
MRTDTATAYALLQTLFVLELTGGVYCVWNIWFHRKDLFIVKRNFWSTLLIVGSLAITTTTNIGLAAFNESCILTPVLIFLTFTTSGTFTFERCMFIYSTYISALSLSETAKKEFGIDLADPERTTSFVGSQEIEENMWFARNRKRFNSNLFSWTKGIAFMVALIVWIPQCVIFFLQFPEAIEAKFNDAQCERATLWGWIISCLFLSFPVSFIIWIGLKFRKIHENFYILQEMQYLMFVAICLCFPFIALFVPQLGRTIFVVWLSITGQVGMWISSCSFRFFRKSSKYETILSTSAQTPSHIQISENANFLREVLIDSGIRWHSFESFLIKEFSVENALLWKAIESLKQDEGNKFEQKARRIYQQFISIDGEYCVNISGQCRKEVEEFFQNGPNPDKPKCIEVFNAVQKEIFNLILTDTFPRYKILSKKLDSLELTDAKVVSI